MTDLEAITALERLLSFVQPGYWSEIHDAIQKGLDALKDQREKYEGKET